MLERMLLILQRMKILTIVGISSILLSSTVKGTCVVESHRCGFPFSSGVSSGEQHYSCQPSTVSGGESVHYCHSQVGNRHVYGVCNGGCYEDDDVTPIQFEEDDAMAFFCKTARSPCQFPFVWNDVTYTSCTSEGSEFPWCALEVDEERVLVGNRWGSCDMDTCQEQGADPPPEPMEARAVFSDQVTGVVVLAQQSSMNPLKIEGRLEGVPSGQYRFRVLRSGCDEVVEEGSGVEEQEDDLIESDGNVTIVSLEKWGVSLFEGEENILGGSIVVQEECSLEVTVDCSESKRISCANIVGSVDELNITMIIIIALVVFIVIILILVVILVICCVRRTLHPTKHKPHHPDLASLDSIDNPYLENKRGRSPLYDELSIPFIDASLPPTPKIGRSSNPLDILLGKSIGSRTSLSETA
eukprot:GFUD01114183.1.p1 GENE.GFUD01114183.1~~GFUD01114183.1.p1  ORF type:complete len:413 (-),score=92.06 GFUD01114183.1:1353-2591(-)